jgi:hypothetical protein
VAVSGGCEAVRTIILLDLPPWRTVPRIVWRTTRNHGRAIQPDGCPERYDWEFIRWVAKLITPACRCPKSEMQGSLGHSM